MISVSISLIPTAEGQLLIPAAEVTSLLRCLAADWLGSPASGEDADVLAAVDEAADAMNQLADQIDAECIACAGEPGAGRPE